MKPDNPFAYLHSEKDILKLVNTIIANTKGDGEKSTEDFWVKSERLFYTALIGYIWYEAPEDEKNFTNDTDKKYINRYPLIEDWGWDRSDCVREILAAGLPLPGKSSCFFCPSMKQPEILALKEHYPDLYQRAMTFEELQIKADEVFRQAQEQRADFDNVNTADIDIEDTVQ